MLLPFTLTVATFVLIECNTPEKRHVPNCVDPQQPEEVYNLEGWVAQLHLQQCVFVAVGENFYAMFLEKRPRPYDEIQEIKDYFLGICDYRTLKKWNLCPLALEAKRKGDCNLREEGEASPRVHRRLCELSDLAQFGDQCNCAAMLRNEKLLNVNGFPTCFRPQMLETICGYNNVCGLNMCTINLVANRVYLVKCDENCFGHKPFCENPEWETSIAREVNSFWTDWSDAKCADSDCIAQYNEANCINKDTGLGDVDCLGPGSSCCAGDLADCKCHVFLEEGMAKVIRTFSVPMEPDYDELSLEEIIKNLPVRNEHRQYKLKDKPKSRQKVIRRHSMKDETYDDTYDHAYNVKIIKDNIHAKVEDKQEQKEERDWLQERPSNLSRKLREKLAAPENSVEPKDFDLRSASCGAPSNATVLSRNAQVRKGTVSSTQPSVHPGRYFFIRGKVDKYGKGGKERDEDEEIEDDTDEQLKQLEHDDAESDDEDIKIDEIDVRTTTTTGGYEEDEIRAAQSYDKKHRNGTAFPEDLGRNVTVDSGGILLYHSKVDLLRFYPILLVILLE